MRKLLSAVFLVAFFCCGCLHSYVNVASDPPGARVFFDYEHKGETPAKVEFLWYGKHKVQLFKEGYGRVDEIVDLRCPPYLYIPFDLVFALIPYQFEDNHHYTFALEPITLEEDTPSAED